MLRLLLAPTDATVTAAPGATVTEAKRAADHPRLGITVEPAELAAVPPGSRAVREELLGQMALLRSEMESLRAVSERVGGLEMRELRWESESDDTLSVNEPEQEEPVEQRLKVNGTPRHRSRPAWPRVARAAGRRGRPSSWARACPD